MLNLAINSIILSGEDSFTIKYSEGNGLVQEREKPIEDLIPNSASYQQQIKSIESALDHKKKHDYLDFTNREVIDLCFEAEELRQPRLKQENQAKHLIKKLAETNLGEKGSLYNKVVVKAINENIDSALLLLEDNKLDGVNFGETLNDNEQVELLFLKASLLRIQNKFDKAVKSYEKALKITEKDAKKVFILHNLALLIKSNYDYNRAEKLLDQALQLAKKSNVSASKSDRSNLGILLNDIGILWYERNEFKKANGYFQEALQIRRELATDNSEMHLFHLTETLNNLGGLNTHEENYNDARTFYKESLGIIDELLKSENNVFILHLAKLLNDYAILERKNNPNPIKAKELYIESLKTFDKLPNDEQKNHMSFKADALRNLSVLQNNTEELGDAQQSLQVALKIYRELAENQPRRFMPNVASVLHTLGNNFALDKKNIEAENSFKEALQIRKKFTELAPEKFEIPLASTYLCLGELYSVDKMDNEVLFLEYLTNSIELFEIYSDRNTFAKEWKHKAMKTKQQELLVKIMHADEEAGLYET